MMKAKHHFIIYPFFQQYTLYLLRRHFNQVIIDYQFVDKRLPLLVLSNHISWWDGFWVMYLNLKLLHRKFHFMMLEEQLKKHWYFNYAGGFSLKKNSRSTIETLTYTISLLKEPPNMVLIFPQGSIHSMFQHNICFQDGVRWILQHLSNEIQVLMVVHLVDFFSKPKPTVYQYVREYKPSLTDFADLNAQYQLFYNECLEKQTKRVET